MDRELAPGPRSNADHAFILAARAWEGADPRDLSGRFSAERRALLEHDGTADSARALEQLQKEHSAQARPDLSRVHSSWWLRALQEEAPSVQRAVVAHLPSGLAEALRDGLGLTAEDLRADHALHPPALQTALALWTVQLVGDQPDRDDDPPVVAALTRFDLRTVTRIIQTTGLAKWAITSRPIPARERNEADRLPRLATLLPAVDPNFLQVVDRDLAEIEADDAKPLARAGMTTIARLLHEVEPYRVRWVLQHLPYRTAKTLRILMGPPSRRLSMIIRWENDLLRASWTLLQEERRISEAWGSPP